MLQTGQLVVEHKQQMQVQRRDLHCRLQPTAVVYNNYFCVASENCGTHGRDITQLLFWKKILFYVSIARVTQIHFSQNV